MTKTALLWSVVGHLVAIAIFAAADQGGVQLKIEQANRINTTQVASVNTR